MRSRCLAIDSSFGGWGTLGWLKQNSIRGSGPKAFLVTDIISSTSVDVGAMGRITTDLAVMVALL